MAPVPETAIASAARDAPKVLLSVMFALAADAVRENWTFAMTPSVIVFELMPVARQV